MQINFAFCMILSYQNTKNVDYVLTKVKVDVNHTFLFVFSCLYDFNQLYLHRDSITDTQQLKYIQL
jgi:hypothetical protein